MQRCWHFRNYLYCDHRLFLCIPFPLQFRCTCSMTIKGYSICLFYMFLCLYASANCGHISVQHANTKLKVMQAFSFFRYWKFLQPAVDHSGVLWMWLIHFKEPAKKLKKMAAPSLLKKVSPHCKKVPAFDLTWTPKFVHATARERCRVAVSNW